MASLGLRGLVSGRSGGGAAVVNPYEAIPGLNSLWTTDLGGLAYDDIQPAVAAVANQSAIERIPLLVQGDISSAPQIAAINGSKTGFQFDGTSTQRLVCWSAPADIIDDTGQGLTLFATIKTSSQHVLEAIYAKGLAAGRWRFATTNGFLQFNLVEAVTSTEIAITSDAVVADGQLHRCVVIYDPAQAPTPTMSMWIDGVQQAITATFAGTLQSTGEPASIGALAANNGTGGFAFTGLVRDIGSYGVPLRGADIATLFSIMGKRAT